MLTEVSAAFYHHILAFGLPFYFTAGLAYEARVFFVYLAIRDAPFAYPNEKVYPIPSRWAANT